MESYRLAPEFRPPAAPSPLRHLPYADQVDSAAKENGLDPALVHAIIAVESRYRQDAVSPKGAIGLMQVMPDTAQRYGVRTPGRSAEENIRAGTRYLRDLMDLFPSRLDLVVAAYNAGEGAVLKYNGNVPPYRETREYVPAVLGKYDEWRALVPVKVPPVAYLPGTRLDEQALMGFRARTD